MIYYLANTIFQSSGLLLTSWWTAVRTCLHSRESRAFLKDVFTKPPILTVIASVLMLIVGFRPPEVFMSFCQVHQRLRLPPGADLLRLHHL